MMMILKLASFVLDLRVVWASGCSTPVVSGVVFCFTPKLMDKLTFHFVFILFSFYSVVLSSSEMALSDYIEQWYTFIHYYKQWKA